MPNSGRRQTAQAVSTFPVELGDDARISKLPFTIATGAAAMLLVWVPRSVQFGSVSPSGALTLLVATLTLCLLPAYAADAAARRQFETTVPRPIRIPWPMWAFLILLLVSFLNTATTGAAGTEAVQNACVYVAFVGAIAFTPTAASPILVERGWELMRDLSTWFSYLTLAAWVFGMGPFASDRAGPSRAIALVGLIALAIVIPGTQRNIWMRFAPFVMVAAMALSLSRTSTAIGLAMLVFLALRGRRPARGKLGKSLVKAVVLLAAVAIAGYLLVVYYTPLRDRFLVGDNAWKVGDTAISTAGRTKIWELVLSNASDHWLLGHGVGSASQLVTIYFPGLDHPHNEYIRFYYDFGIIGVALFFVGYFALAWRVLRSARRTGHPLHWAALIAMLSIALAAITDNPLVYPFVTLPLGALIGLSLAMSNFELIEDRRFATAGQGRSP